MNLEHWFTKSFVKAITILFKIEYLRKYYIDHVISYIINKIPITKMG